MSTFHVEIKQDGAGQQQNIMENKGTVSQTQTGAIAANPLAELIEAMKVEAVKDELPEVEMRGFAYVDGIIASPVTDEPEHDEDGWEKARRLILKYGKRVLPAAVEAAQAYVTATMESTPGGKALSAALSAIQEEAG